MGTSILSTTGNQPGIHSSSTSEISPISDQEENRHSNNGQGDKKKRSDLEKKVSMLANHKKTLLQVLLLKQSLLMNHALFYSRHTSKEQNAALMILGLKRNVLMEHYFSINDLKDEYKQLLKEALHSENEKLLEKVLLGERLENRDVFFSKSYLINGHYLPAKFPKEKILKR